MTVQVAAQNNFTQVRMSIAAVEPSTMPRKKTEKASGRNAPDASSVIVANRSKAALLQQQHLLCDAVVA
jgi:hypothetical protein